MSIIVVQYTTRQKAMTFLYPFHYQLVRGAQVSEMIFGKKMETLSICQLFQFSPQNPFTFIIRVILNFRNPLTFHLHLPNLLPLTGYSSKLRFGTNLHIRFSSCQND